MGRKNNIKNTITSKFKDKLWEDHVLEGKRKLRYYKEVIKPTLDNQNYLSVSLSNKKKMNIPKIRTNSHDLWSETRRWSIPKAPWNYRISRIFYSRQVEGEKHFLLDCPALTHILSQFPTICHTSSLLDLLNQPTYSYLGALISLLFDNICHRRHHQFFNYLFQTLIYIFMISLFLF